jgi:hypothetical protein
VLVHRAPRRSLRRVTACNGYPELCDRRLDRVVFATSHNSMGGADNPAGCSPTRTVASPALEDGVRAFLIDAHYGIPFGDKVKTIMENEVAAMAKYEARSARKAWRPRCAFATGSSPAPNRSRSLTRMVSVSWVRHA